MLLVTILSACTKVSPDNRPSKPSGTAPVAELSSGVSTSATPTQTVAPTDTPTPTNSPTPTSSPTPSPSPTPIRSRDEFSLEELYPDKLTDTVYRVHLEQYLEKCYIADVQTNSGFVLVTAYRYEPYPYYAPEDGEEPEYSRVILFHVGVPDIVMVKVFAEEIDADPILYEDGSFTLHFPGGDFRTYDLNLQEVCRFEVPGGSLFAATENRKIWVKTGNDADDEAVAYHLYSPTGERLASYDAGTLDIHKFLYERDGKGYFAAFRPDYSDYLVSLDYAKGEFCRVDGTHIENDCYGEMLEYSTDTTWFYTLDGLPDPVYAIPKFSESEISQTHRNGQFVSAEWIFGDDDDYFTIYRVYDVAERTLLGSLNTGGMGLVNSDVMHLTDRGYALCDVSFADEEHDLIIWDVSAEKKQPIEGSRKIEPSAETMELRKYAQRFFDEFGIRVYFEEVDMHGHMFNSFRLISCDDYFRLQQMMQELYEVVSIFPEGFWTDILADGEKDAVRFFLCDSFARQGLSVIEDAAALTSSSTNEICMAYGTRYMYQFKTTFVHETMHMMEVRIGKFCEENDLDFYGYWLRELNTTKYGYYDAYTDKQGRSIEDYSGTYYDKPGKAWFIDAYSRTNEREDRARILENLYAGNNYYFRDSKHLMAKAQNLCAIIRAAFPSVGQCETPMPWENDIGVPDTSEYLARYKSGD